MANINSTLVGGTTNGSNDADSIRVRHDKNSINAYNGNDTILVESSSNTINGGNGNDVIMFQSWTENNILNNVYDSGYHGMDGNDTIISAASKSYIQDTTGSNYFVSGGTNNTLEGGDNYVDSFFIYSVEDTANVTIIGGENTEDNITISTGYVGVEGTEFLDSEFNGATNETINVTITDLDSLDALTIINSGMTAINHSVTSNGTYLYDNTGQIKIYLPNVTDWNSIRRTSLSYSNGGELSTTTLDRATVLAGTSGEIPQQTVPADTTPADTAPSNLINGTSGADSIVALDDNVTVYALAGNDTLKISGNYGYYDGGAGNDKLSLDGGAEGNTLTGGAGNDTLYTNGLGNVILYSGGKDVIHGFGENDSLVIDGTVTKTSQSGANVLITVGSASNVITIKDVALGNLDTTGGALTYTDEIIDEPEPDYPVSLTASADKETFSDEGATVYALNGNDTIENAGGESYINGGNGNDLLINTANNVTLEGGAGSDRLSLSADASGNVLIGGAGNDSIFTNGAGNLIRYSAGSGKDAVFGFAGDDSIEVDGTISKVAQSGANVLVTVGSSSNVITIKNTALGNISVDGGVITYTEEALPDYPKSLTSGADSLEVSDDEAEVYALAGNDTLKISGNYGYFDGGAGNDKLSLDGGAEGNTLAGGAGNDTIYTNGIGNVIQYSGGKDVILGFGENDSIEVNGTISKVAQSGAW